MAALDVERVHASFDTLAATLQAHLATLVGAAEYWPWVLNDPTCQLLLSWHIATAQGLRLVTILLNTCTWHCFIYAGLAAGLACLVRLDHCL
jgi:hypothetical protein